MSAQIKATGDEATKLAKFRQVRDQIDSKVKEWLTVMP
jgi:hypothetical protein